MIPARSSCRFSSEDWNMTPTRFRLHDNDSTPPMRISPFLGYTLLATPQGSLPTTESTADGNRYPLFSPLGRDEPALQPDNPLVESSSSDANPLLTRPRLRFLRSTGGPRLLNRRRDEANPGATMSDDVQAGHKEDAATSSNAADDSFITKESEELSAPAPACGPSEDKCKKKKASPAPPPAAKKQSKRKASDSCKGGKKLKPKKVSKSKARSKAGCSTASKRRTSKRSSAKSKSKRRSSAAKKPRRATKKTTKSSKKRDCGGGRRKRKAPQKSKKSGPPAKKKGRGCGC